MPRFAIVSDMRDPRGILRGVARSIARRAAAMALLASSLWVAGCDVNSTAPVPDATPTQRRAVAIVALTFANIGSSNMTASALVAGSVSELESLRAARAEETDGTTVAQDLEVPANRNGSGNATIQLDLVQSVSFTHTSVDGAHRYFQSTYRVRNAQLTDSAAFNTPRRNLTFVPVRTAGTIGQTPVRVFRRPDGSAADPALALQLVPTGFVVVDGSGMLTAPVADVLQAFTESEIGAVTGTPAVIDLFPYGFMVRRVGTRQMRTLPASPDADEFAGIINFAYRIPLQPNPADDPSTITLIMLALDDSDTRLTQSLQEHNPLARHASRERALTLDATIRTLLPGGTFPFAGGYRTICSVRTAGTVGTPLAFMIDVPSSLAAITPNPYAADGSGSFIDRTSPFQLTFTAPVVLANTSPVHVRGLQSNFAFLNQTFTGFGTNTITTPNGSFFPGEEIEIVVTTAYACPEPWVGRVRVSSNLSAGIFTPASAFAVGDQPSAVAVGDLNNDNIVDVISANPGDNNVSVLLGNGDGTLQPHRTFPAGAQPSAVALFDVNSDDNLDVVVTNPSSASLLSGNGDGTFQPRVQIGGLPNLGAVTTGDVNGDAIADVILASTRGELQVLLGGGAATFVTTLPIDRPFASPSARQMGLTLADLNNDGRLDIVATDRINDRAFLLLGNGDGTFQPAQFRAAGDAATGLAVGDLNRDGKLDLAIVNSMAATVSILLGNGDGTFQAQLLFATGASTSHDIAVGDLNGDGRLDVAVAKDDGVAVLIGNGDGTLQPQRTLASPAASSIALADLNGDGILDLVVGNDLNFGTVSVLLGIQ